jgi:hypothetical protein
MRTLKPRIFVSYAWKDIDIVHRVRVDLLRAQIDCWIDLADIQAGDRLNPVIEDAISRCDLFFAFVTDHYLASKWCMKELRFALTCDKLTVTPYLDRRTTLDNVPAGLIEDLAFGVIDDASYTPALLELAGRAWETLQVKNRVVPADDHILAGPAIFDDAGYNRADLMARTRRELVLAGPNLRSWLSDNDSKRGLIMLVKERRIRVTLILATYETLSPISPEGAVHLRESVKDIRRMTELLDGDEKLLMSVHFHVGASTLSAVFIDPTTPDGILFFSPRWAIQFLPQDRLTCVIDKTVNSPALFKAVYNGVLLMTQGDAKSLADMTSDL